MEGTESGVSSHKVVLDSSNISFSHEVNSRESTNDRSNVRLSILDDREESVCCRSSMTTVVWRVLIGGLVVLSVWQGRADETSLSEETRVLLNVSPEVEGNTCSKLDHKPSIHGSTTSSRLKIAEKEKQCVFYT